MPKKFLNVKEVARLLGVTPLTVRNWDNKGKLSAYRHPANNYRLYKVEEVEELLKNIENSREDVQNSSKQLAKRFAQKPRKLKIDSL